MSFSDLKSLHTFSRIQVIIFTDNGFLLDTCNTLFDLSNQNHQSLFEYFPFLKNYTHLFKILSETKPKKFTGIEYKSDNQDFILDISLMKKEGQLACIIEDVSKYYASSSPQISINDEHLATEIDKIKQIQKIRQDHFSKIAHDIKLPLTEIVGTTHLLKNFVEDNRGRDYIDALSSSARNLDAMLNDLISFSKSEAYKFKLSERCFSIDSELRSAAKSFEYKAQSKNIELELNIGADVPNEVIGDSMRLWQIIYNLLDNALKFTSRGKIKVNVDTLEKNNSHCLLKFSVIDTGIGIPQENLVSIFETYQQVHEEKDSQNGFGIGLSIVKQLVELQDGTLTVDSKLGEGTNFTFTLDYAIEEEAQVY